MRYVFAVLLIASMLAGCGCDDLMVSGALNPSSFSGTVSIVRLTVSGDGTQFTLVTLTTATGSQDFNFCGNVVNQFPMNSAVQGSFNPGTPCGSIIRVTIVG